MSYILVPQNSSQIYPLNKHSYLESVVRNLRSVATYYGFIGPHGKRLNAWGDANQKDFYKTKGSLNGRFSPIFGYRFKRWENHFDNAQANNLISYRENHRHVVYAPYAATLGSNTNNSGQPNVITAGDLVWWDTLNDSVCSAKSYPWTTDLATTQADFSQVFLGVALDSQPTGNPSSDPYNSLQTAVCRVDISPLSFWDFTDANSENHFAGDIMAPAQGVGNTLAAQKLVQVAPLGLQTGYGKGIARVARVDYPTASTSLLCHVQSTFWGHETSDIEGS